MYFCEKPRAGSCGAGRALHAGHLRVQPGAHVSKSQQIGHCRYVTLIN